jgi:hypothetical protein
MNPTDTTGTDTTGTDTTGTDTTGTDTTGTDTTGTDTTGTGSPVTIAEIAEFVRHLRALSRPSTGDNDPTGDPAVKRAAFLARKADLFARIAAARPDLIPTATSPTFPTVGGTA